MFRSAIRLGTDKVEAARPDKKRWGLYLLVIFTGVICGRVFELLNYRESIVK